MVDKETSNKSIKTIDNKFYKIEAIGSTNVTSNLEAINLYNIYTCQHWFITWYQ